MHTACVWSEKLPFAGYSVVKDHSGGNIAPRNLSVIAGRIPPDPHRSGPPRTAAPVARGDPFAPLRFLAARSLAFARYVATLIRCGAKIFQRLSNQRARSGGLRGLREGRVGQRPTPTNKVENTGLEPVTSWLQTRRSPS